MNGEGGEEEVVVGVSFGWRAIVGRGGCLCRGGGVAGQTIVVRCHCFESVELVYERGRDTVRDYYTVLLMGVYMFLTVEITPPT